MIETLVIVGIVALLSALTGALIASKIRRDFLNSIHAQQQGWERAQESHQRNWEAKQEKDALELETRLTNRILRLEKTWEAWEAKDQERIKELAKQHEEASARLQLQRDLARLPRIEEAPLIPKVPHQHKHTFPNWRPPVLQGADLAGHDFSHRYLGYVDLRDAQLSKASFFMADLTGAYLAGADLSGADLSGANLSGADLRGATLTGTNLNVADLHQAILIDADLRGARSLTPQQIYNAIYDSTTQLDAEIDITKPRVHSMQPAVSKVDLEAATTLKIPAITLAETPASANKPVLIPRPETPPPASLPRSEVLIPQAGEPPLSSPLPSSDTLLDLKVSDPLADTPENTDTEELDTRSPKAIYNGKG